MPRHRTASPHNQGYGAGPAHQHRSPLITRTSRPGPDQLVLDKNHSLMNAVRGGRIRLLLPADVAGRVWSSLLLEEAPWSWIKRS
jgi:hypothetical protein